MVCLISGDDENCLGFCLLAGEGETRLGFCRLSGELLFLTSGDEERELRRFFSLGLVFGSDVRELFPLFLCRCRTSGDGEREPTLFLFEGPFSGEEDSYLLLWTVLTSGEEVSALCLALSCLLISGDAESDFRVCFLVGTSLSSPELLESSSELSSVSESFL